KPGDMRTPAPFAVEVTFDDDRRTATLKYTEAKAMDEAKSVEDTNRETIIRTLKANPAGVPTVDVENLLEGRTTTRRNGISSLIIGTAVVEYKQQRKVYLMLNPNAPEAAA